MILSDMYVAAVCQTATDWIRTFFSSEANNFFYLELHQIRSILGL